jgi:hypothetical protein
MSPKNHTALTQSHCSNHEVSALAHAVAAATVGRQHGSSSISGLTWGHPSHILSTNLSFKHKRVHNHTSTSIAVIAENPLIYASTTPHTIPACGMSLGLLTVAIPEARDFVESLLPYMNLGDTFGN